jgi:thioredoxin 1
MLTQGYTMPIAITENNFNQLESTSGLVVLDVYATWCPPCKQMEPIFLELEKELDGRCTFAKLNVDEARDLSITLQITSIPTFIFMVDGAIQDKVVGSMSKDTLKAKIESYL